jgi:putative membrane protein
MSSILVNWLLSAITLVIVSQYVPGFHVASFTTALVVAIVLGIINAVIKPIITLLTLPINILTLGLFSFVINAALLIFVSRLIQGFKIENFTTALLAAIILWLINLLINFVIFPIKAV